MRHGLMQQHLRIGSVIVVPRADLDYDILQVRQALQLRDRRFGIFWKQTGANGRMAEPLAEVPPQPFRASPLTRGLHSQFSKGGNGTSLLLDAMYLPRQPSTGDS